MKEHRKILEEESGGVYLFVLSGCLACVILLGLIFNIANNAIVKMSLQGTVDSAVITGASWIAGGLNTIAFFNLLMITFIGLILAIIVVEIALLSCNALYATVFLAIVAAACNSINGFFLPVAVVKGVPALWNATYAIEEVQNTYTKIFPLIAGVDTIAKLNQIGSSNRKSSIKEPEILIYPIVPSFDPDAEGQEKLILHIKKGNFGDLSKGIKEIVERAIKDTLSFLPGGKVVGKAVGWVTGKATEMATKNLGEILNKAVKGSTYEGEREEKIFKRKLKFDGNSNLKNKEEGYLDIGDECQRRSCKKLLSFLKGLEEYKGGEGVKLEKSRFDEYTFIKTRKSGEMTFTTTEHIDFSYRYYHFVWNIKDEDIDGDGNVKGDGCRRRWFTGAKEGGFSAFKSMKESIEEVKSPYWINLDGAGCEDFDYEIIEDCDGREYVKEKYILREVKVEVKNDLKVSPPPRLPSPYVLHQDVPESLRMSALSYTLKTRKPRVFSSLFKKGSPFGSYAVAQACVKDFHRNPAKAGQIFYHSTWDEYLCPVTVLDELLGNGKTGEEIKKYLKDYVLLH